MAEPSIHNNQQQTKKQRKKKYKEEIDEPKVNWKKSKAKSLLSEDIMEGTVPLQAKDENGEPTMPLKGISAMHPEHAEYHYSKFSGRLSSLRKTIADLNDRAEEDHRDFAAYVSNHPSSSFSHHGYIQWQGSEAQELLKQDMEARLHETRGKEELFDSRSEYYLNFPHSVFRDKIYQEVRTAKYLYTIKERGKLHQAS